ncbi:MAG: anthranilate phosphoribosyltransferase [Bacteroidia bacterium]|nr:anthranilate phosphoribosyltransferase [Bacteroidia bacterium]
MNTHTPPAAVRSLKDVLNYLFGHHTLNREEARTVLGDIASGQCPPAQIAAFMTVYLMRKITVEELAGFRDAMLERCIPADLADFDPIDLCGTGGDGRDTFNISTLAAFITAGAGVPVAKHGNYGVSSVSGSSNVVEYLGGTFTNDPAVLRRQMEASNICFMHAPLFHPAMKHVGPIRKELGVKTFFNMLGPMVNPAFPRKQLVGVFSLELARLYAYLYQQSGKRFAILHSLDGYDEISLTGPCKVISNQGERVLTPEHFGMAPVRPEALYGGADIESAARLFLRVLRNEGTEAQKHVAVINAGMAIACAREGMSLEAAVALAGDSLESGKALGAFERFVGSRK